MIAKVTPVNSVDLLQRSLRYNIILNQKFLLLFDPVSAAKHLLHRLCDNVDTGLETSSDYEI